MINTQRVAVFNCIEQLQEDVLDEVILAKVPALVEDLGEEVTILAIVHNDICEILVLYDAVEGNDVGVSRGKLVGMDLVQVQLASAGWLGGGVGDGDGGSDVRGMVDDSITAPTKQFGER